MVADIQREVASLYGLPVEVMRQPSGIIGSHERQFARPRQVAMYLSRRFTRSSFPTIGRIFGGRDHATVIHACHQVEKLILSDPETREAVEKLEAQFGERA